MVSRIQHAVMAPIVARGSIYHPGPKVEALEEFRRELWMILQGQKEGYRQLHINYSGSKSHGTGMAADVDKIIEDALSMVRFKFPEEGGGRIGYVLQLSGPKAASPEQRAKVGVETDD